jgi:hypothetical protein
VRRSPAALFGVVLLPFFKVLLYQLAFLFEMLELLLVVLDDL